MTTLDEERLYRAARLVPPVLSPPIREVHERAARLQRSRNTRRLVGGVGLASVVVGALAFSGRLGSAGPRHLPDGGKPEAIAQLSCDHLGDDRTAPRVGQRRLHASGPGDRSCDRVPGRHRRCALR